MFITHVLGNILFEISSVDFDTTKRMCSYHGQIFTKHVSW